MSERRYFWLKLPTGFFKRHDIKILEAMDNGKDYLLFYMKLMLESLDHEGRLRFSDAIPYDHKMLSIVTDTNIDIVKNAMEVLARMQLITIMDDETIYIQAVERMIGSESAAAERQRRSRDNRRALLEAKCDNVTACHNLSQNGHREIELEKESEENKAASGKPEQPAIDFGTLSPSMISTIEKWLQYKKERRESYKPTGLKSLITEIQNNVNRYGEQAVIDLIHTCMASNWRGIIFDRLKNPAPQQSHHGGGGRRNAPPSGVDRILEAIERGDFDE